MPIQTLGIFDSVYDWVVNKLINPLMTWLGNILSSIFNWIFEEILQPYVFPVIENLWNSIFVNVANVLYAGLYSNYCKCLELLDTITKGFDVLIGLSDITYLDEHGIQQSDTLLNYVIFHSNMRTIIAGVTFIALALAIMFAIYSVIKSTLDFDFEGRRPVGRVMTAAFKTMIAFLMVPLIVWVGMQLLSVVLKATANAISNSSGDMSLGSIILAVSSVSAGKGGWNEAKQEFSMTDPSAPWYKLTHNEEFPNYGYLNFAGDINISEIDYIIGFVSAIGCIIITLICLVTFIKRIYDISLAYALFHDEEYTLYTQDYINKVISELERSLKEAGAEKILIRRRNFYAVDKTQFSCDLFDYIKGTPSAVNLFNGEYMLPFEWGAEAMKKYL